MSQDLKLLARYVDGGDRLDDHMSQQLYAREKKQSGRHQENRARCGDHAAHP